MNDIGATGVQASLPGMAGEGWGLGKDPSPTSPMWGGYPDVCTDFEISDSRDEKKIRDPRLDDLAAMGLRKVLLDIAEEIGVDNYMKMWKIVDSDYESNGHGDSVLKLRMPCYRLYRRYQRNRYAEALFRAGHSVIEVSKKIERYMCEKLHKNHVIRLRKKS
jgi:hypothetical protein